MNRDLKSRSQDELIERTLRGLRGVEIPLGLEDRVLRALRAEDEVAGSTGHGGWSAGWGVWAGVGVACAAVLVFALTSVQGSRVEPQVALQSGTPVTGTSRISTPLSRTAEPVAQARVEDGREMQVRGERPAVRSVGRRVSSRRVRGLPPPEPPLTQEEKLLQRVARSGNQQEMALLNPEERAREEASARAQFRAFTEQQY